MNIYCPTCENACSEQAISCPQCGHPFLNPQPKQAKKLIIHPKLLRNHPLLFCMTIPAVGLIGLAMLLSPSPTTGVIILSFVVLVPTALYIEVLNTSLTLDTVEITYRTGVLSKSTSQVRYQDIRNIIIRQGLMQRLFNVGSLGISTAAQSNVEITISGIWDPEYVRDIINRRVKGD